MAEIASRLNYTVYCPIFSHKFAVFSLIHSLFAARFGQTREILGNPGWDDGLFGRGDSAKGESCFFRLIVQVFFLTFVCD